MSRSLVTAVIGIVVVHALMGFTCSVTFPANCDCTLTHGSITVVIGTGSVDVGLTIGNQTTRKAFGTTEDGSICGICNDGNNKKAGVKPKAGFKWGTVSSCADLETVCC